jgi:aspartate/tyrosine/aromatic aminotransferase
MHICRRFIKDPVVLIPNPTWGNHHNVVREAGVSERATQGDRAHMGVESEDMTRAELRESASTQ